MSEAKYQEIASSDLCLDLIYREQCQYVWNSLRRLGVQQRDLEDLMHDTFIIVNRRLSDFDSTRPIRPWLYGISMRVASDYRKSARVRREKLLDKLPESQEGGEGPEKEVHAQQNRELVLAALDTLEFKHRTIFVMHDVNEHTMAEAAAELGEPLPTLYSRLRVARSQFAAAIKELQKPQLREEDLS